MRYVCEAQRWPCLRPPHRRLGHLRSVFSVTPHTEHSWIRQGRRRHEFCASRWGRTGLPLSAPSFGQSRSDKAAKPSESRHGYGLIGGVLNIPQTRRPNLRRERAVT
jgi:hypothetical protein